MKYTYNKIAVLVLLAGGVISGGVRAEKETVKLPISPQTVQVVPETVDVPKKEVAALKDFSAKQWTVPGINITMNKIPAGEFVMGSPANEPARKKDEVQHTVKISKPFYMGIYEVTQNQFYSVFMPDVDFAQWTFFRGAITKGAAFHFRRQFPGIRHTKGLELLLNNPMESVTWQRALDFCDVINQRERAAGRLPDGYEYRLPTEAEWEYASRAGTKGLFNVEKGIDIQQIVKEGKDRKATGEKELNRFAFSDPASSGYASQTSMVGYKRLPNAFGLSDMHGNVAEWCLDTYAPYKTDGVAVDPVVLEEGAEKVVRGGAFMSSYRVMRSATRLHVKPTAAYYGIIGFRVVLAPKIDLPAPKADTLTDEKKTASQK